MYQSNNISGCVAARNSVKFGYPLRACLASLRPICDEVVLAYDPDTADGNVRQDGFGHGGNADAEDCAALREADADLSLSERDVVRREGKGKTRLAFGQSDVSRSAGVIGATDPSAEILHREGRTDARSAARPLVGTQGEIFRADTQRAR